MENTKVNGAIQDKNQQQSNVYISQGFNKNALDKKAKKSIEIEEKNTKDETTDKKSGNPFHGGLNSTNIDKYLEYLNKIIDDC